MCARTRVGCEMGGEEATKANILCQFAVLAHEAAFYYFVLCDQHTAVRTINETGLERDQSVRVLRASTLSAGGGAASFSRAIDFASSD